MERVGCLCENLPLPRLACRVRKFQAFAATIANGAERDAAVVLAPEQDLDFTERFVMAGLTFLYATIAIGSALIFFAYQ